MKVRVCPNCGKHNDEGAFSCADCGTTLSMKTLMDIDSGQFLNVKRLAGYTELEAICPYFEKDVVDVLRNVVKINETVIWGCNLTHLARVLPWLVTFAVGHGFWFGYLIMTDQRLVCVYFASDMIGRKPTRPCLAIWANYNSRQPALVLERPGFDLSPDEKASRQVIEYSLRDITSIRLEAKGANDVCVVSLIMTLKEGNETSLTFYGMHDAEKAQKLIQTHQTELAAH